MADKPQFSVVPVHDSALEAAVLNRLINERFATLQVMHLLDEGCFYDSDHLRLFRIVHQLESEGREVSMVSVTDLLNNTLSPESVAQLIARTASKVFAPSETMELDVMVLRLQEYSKRRKLGLVCQKLMLLHSDMTYPLDQGISEVTALIDSTIMGSTESFVTLSQKLEDLVKVIEDNQHDETRHVGLLCGIPQIDREGGLPADGLVVVGAKASHGKTTFATNVAVNALKRNKRVAFFSMEMSQQKVSSRILAMESGVSSNDIQRKKLCAIDRQKVLDTIKSLKSSVASQFYFDNRKIRDLDALVMSIRAMKKSVGIDCVVVDYLQLMNDSPGHKAENTNKLLGNIAHRLHEVAQDMGITIILLSQINRSVTGEPNMSHLRDSGEIAEAADMVLILYNADHENATFAKPYDTVDPKEKILVKAEKNRDGATQTFLLGFKSSETRMFELSQEEVKKGNAQQELMWKE